MRSSTARRINPLLSAVILAMELEGLGSDLELEVDEPRALFWLEVTQARVAPFVVAPCQW